MKKYFPPSLFYCALMALYLLHNDLWLWNDATLVLGFPIGLLYHFSFCVLTALVLFLLVRCAWPHHLEVESGEENIG